MSHDPDASLARPLAHLRFAHRAFLGVGAQPLAHAARVEAVLAGQRSQRVPLLVLHLADGTWPACAQVGKHVLP